MNVPVELSAEAQGATFGAVPVYQYYSRLVPAPTAVWDGPEAGLWRKALNAQLRVRALRFEAAHVGEFNHRHPFGGLPKRIAEAEAAYARALRIARVASGLTA